MGQRTPSPGRWGHSGGSEDDDDYDHNDYDYEPDVNVQPAKQWTAPGSIVVASPTHSATGRLNGSQGGKRLGIANFIPHEILVHIFKKLTTKGDQHSALLVSRAWCQCAVELLWHKLAVGNLASLLQMMHIISRKDQTFNYATFIRRLNFSVHASGMTDEIFIRLAPCIRLERLTLGNCASLTDTSLVAVFASCSSLIAVDLNGVPEVTDDAIITLANTTTKLQGINLTKCARITDAGILALAGHAPMLRRIKLSGLVLLTDVSVAAIANNCPLLLEIDLSNCSGLTDASIRDIWVHQRHLRELQLSVITSLTDDAFPSPPPPPPSRTGGGSAPTRLPTALPPQILRSPERRLPLLLPSLFDHLRILDLTSCAHLTDEGVEGIISNSPKIRQIVLTRCSSLTDEALMSISKLAKNLHFIHLGHVSHITDRGVTRLVQACPRIRYIDLANCTNLTDLSVLELASLSKLRRVGLVRLPNLTDNAVFALSEKHAGLERIHLSYCDSISVGAVHFLLQRLPKLTHLSLTGIPQFRRKDLRQFCRLPPRDFNQHQRLAFCVYSGKGVSELRKYLQNLALSERNVELEQEVNVEMGNAEMTEGDGTPAEDAESEDPDENEGDGNETPTEDAIVWPAPPNGSMPALDSPAPRRRIDRNVPGRQLHSANGSAGLSGPGGSANAARALYPHPHPDGAGSSGSSSSRHRPRSAARVTQHQQQPPQASSTSRSPDAVRNEQASGRGSGMGVRRFWGVSTPSAPRNNGLQQQHQAILEADVIPNGSSVAGPSSPTMTVRPGRRMSGSAGGGGNSSRSSPAPTGSRGSSHASIATRGSPLPHTSTPSRRSPAPNIGQSYQTIAETQSQYMQASTPLASSTRLQELLAGLGSGPGPSAIHPSQLIETPTGPMERGPARRAAADAAIARFEAFNATRRATEGYVIETGGNSSTLSLSPNELGIMNGNANVAGGENSSSSALVEIEQALSDAFPQNQSNHSRSSRGRTFRDDVNTASSSLSGGIAGDGEGGMSNGNSGRRGGAGAGVGGIQQFTNLFKRTPDY